MLKFSPQSTLAISAIAQQMQKAYKAFGTLSNEEQEACLNFHSEGSSLNHCLRWGEQAAEDILKAISEDGKTSAVVQPNFIAKITRTPCNHNRSEWIDLGTAPGNFVRVKSRGIKGESVVFNESSAYKDYVVDEIYTIDDDVKTIHYRDTGLSFAPSMSKVLGALVKDVQKVVVAS